MRAAQLLLPVILAGSAATADELDSLVDRVAAGVRPERAMETMRRVYETDRWFTFPKFHETIGYLRQRLASLGLADIETPGAPADGVTQAGYWTMPLAWDVRHARLEIVSPEPAEGFRVLADYAAAPASVGMWSGPTPPGGVLAEVVAVDKAEDIGRLDLKGKLALTARNSAGWKRKLVRAGAIGAINAFTENPELRDGRQWINAWGDHGWAYTATSTPLLSFSVTPRQAGYVRELLGKGRVQVRAVVDSRYYKDSYPYITARVRGTGPEEVLALGHTAEQGAHDNATGVAAMAEALAAIEDGIRAGRLARPRRSIRILAMPELYASMHYVAAHGERMARTVAAICVDTPAGPYEMKGTEYTFHMNPHPARSYTDALVLRVAKSWLGRRDKPRPFHWKPFTSGTDTFLAEPMIGVPTVWPYGGTGVHSHHNSEDRPETVDPRSLRDLAAITAAYLYAIAQAGEKEALEFARIAAANPEVSTAESVRGVLRLVPPARRGPLVPEIERIASSLPAPKPAAAAAAPEKAARLVVKRKRFGTLPLDELPEEEREGFPSGAWDNTAILSLYWCDGKRTLADVIRLTQAETGPTKFDFVGYYEFLARKGYVELISR